MRFYLLFLISFAFACSSSDQDKKAENNGSEDKVIQAYTLSGTPLYIPERSAESKATLEANLESARQKWEANPSEENYIWYARRMAYINRYNEAIEIYTEGLKKYPDSYRLFRHRGHRYISIRKMDEAIRDFTKAADLIGEGPIETEPDGAPNQLNIPLSNTHFNIYYHLGLAHYLKADWVLAEMAYRQCLEYSINDDLKTATSDWLYMTLMKQDKKEEAMKILDPINSSMEIIENDSYYKRLLMYKGELAPDEIFSNNFESLDAISLATQGYGVGNYYLQMGDSAKAYEIFRKVTEGQSWSAFGFIAAEAELLRR